MCHFQVCSMAFWIPLDATLKPCNGGFWAARRERANETLESLTPSVFFISGKAWMNLGDISLIIHPSHWPVPSKMLLFLGGDFDPIHPWSLTSGTWKKKELRISGDFQNLATIFKFQSLNFRGVLTGSTIYIYIHSLLGLQPTVLWRSAPASRPSLRYWHLYLKKSWCWNTQNTRPW